MITTKPGQSVTLIELEEDGHFIEVRQEEDNLAVIIPPIVHRLSMKRNPRIHVLRIAGFVTFVALIFICISIVAFSNFPFPLRIFFLLLVLVSIAFLIDAMLDSFGKITLQFTRTHLRIERQYAFFRFCRRISIRQVGEARDAMCDDLDMDLPEDVVTIPLGKNDCFNIHYIKAYEDEKYLVNVVNTFLTQIRG